MHEIRKIIIAHKRKKILYLNQARAGHRPALAWFLKIVSVQTSVCVFVCVYVRVYVRVYVSLPPS